jgi:uncharacterized protein YdeI (YjbR/CyaY-like superfamily)
MALPAPLKRFRTPAALRAWLAKNHQTAAELLLRCYKTSAANHGVTYAQALDEALCYGWIDGIRRSVDEISFSVRFTPRQPRSTWSRVNIGHAKRLLRDGRMAPPGLAAFRAHQGQPWGTYPHQRKRITRLAPAYARRLRADRAAWAYWEDEAPWYRRACTRFVMEAKKEETRIKRLERLMDYCRRGVRIPPLQKP